MREIIINHTKEKNIITLVEDYNVVEKYEENADTKRLEGNIYLGKIQRVLPGLQAVFVDIGNNKNAFLHIKDIIPKASNYTGNKNENFDEIDINKYVKVGMPVIVQVKKDEVLQKGPRVSTHINLPGRFVVIMPGTKFVTVSQKIEDTDEIKRLKDIALENLNRDLGIIIRTSAIGKSKEDIKKDLRRSYFQIR
ncbi:MAG: ribonuclease E/G [Clostridia bacterium]|nr:ribonuclease E/G [Clostridia bacterium]